MQNKFRNLSSVFFKIFVDKMKLLVYSKWIYRIIVEWFDNLSSHTNLYFIIDFIKIKKSYVNSNSIFLTCLKIKKKRIWTLNCFEGWVPLLLLNKYFVVMILIKSLSYHFLNKTMITIFFNLPMKYLYEVTNTGVTFIYIYIYIYIVWHYLIVFFYPIQFFFGQIA